MNKTLYWILFFGFAVHLLTVAFIYLTGFRPVGGGADYELYHDMGSQLADRFRHGNFSLQGVFLGHGFSIFVGVIYALTLSDAVIPTMLSAWFFVLALLFTYLIVTEIGGSQKLAFLVCIGVILYPSYLYFGSLMLKDTIIIPLILGGLLLAIKMLKSFSWSKFALFFIILTALMQLRFYIGYALLFSFIISWFLSSAFKLKKKTIYGVFIIIILGFSPMVWGSGYYGLNMFKFFLNIPKITFYREVVYSSQPQQPAQQPPQPQSQPQQPAQQPPQLKEVVSGGAGSSFTIETGFKNGKISFLVNSLESFIFALLGPFPWQFRYNRQAVSLIETIPWYLLLVTSIYGIVKFARKKKFIDVLRYYRFSAPLLFFSLLALGALSLYINNYGIIVRIRIPVFISLGCVMFVAFNGNIENYYKILYGKISGYRRSRVRGL